MTRLRILVLGSAAGGGVPQWNCRCRVCSLAWAGDPRVRQRTQSSIAVSADGRGWALINGAPEVLTQIRAVPALQPPAGAPRGTPIAAVMVTNGDIDHIAGLLSLRESQPFTLYATADILAVLGQNRVFDVLADGVVERRTIRLDEPFVLVPGIEARPFAVPGK